MDSHKGENLVSFVKIHTNMVGVGEDEFWREMDEQNRSDENDKILE